jgi:hypothetical protein
VGVAFNAFVGASVAAGAAGVLTIACVFVAVGEGFGVGVTRTWNPPQASMADTSKAKGNKIGQRLCVRFIVASEMETGSWKLAADAGIQGPRSLHGRSSF